LQLFYVGTDHGVWSRWRNPDGAWSAEQILGGNLAVGEVSSNFDDFFSTCSSRRGASLIW
jgi:hypothetical protein